MRSFFLAVILLALSNCLYSQETTCSNDSLICLTFEQLKLLENNKEFSKSFFTYGDKVESSKIKDIFIKLNKGEYSEKKASLAIELYSKLGDNWEFAENPLIGVPSFENVDEMINKKDEIIEESIGVPKNE